MRALFSVAALLGTTVAALMSGMSAQEFNRWQVWMQAEQVGPEWQAVHRAELLAAASNGGQYRHRAGRPFASADFARPDPWADAVALTPEQEQARLEREVAALERQMDGGA